LHGPEARARPHPWIEFLAIAFFVFILWLATTTMINHLRRASAKSSVLLGSVEFCLARLCDVSFVYSKNKWSHHRRRRCLVVVLLRWCISKSTTKLTAPMPFATYIIPMSVKDATHVPAEAQHRHNDQDLDY
jgi:hypothetical protein